ALHVPELLPGREVPDAVPGVHARRGARRGRRHQVRGDLLSRDRRRLGRLPGGVPGVPVHRSPPDGPEAPQVTPPRPPAHRARTSLLLVIAVAALVAAAAFVRARAASREGLDLKPRPDALEYGVSATALV